MTRLVTVVKRNRGDRSFSLAELRPEEGEKSCRGLAAAASARGEVIATI